MKIPENQIELKKVVGTSGSGEPVLYVVSKGGLHAFFTKHNGQVTSLGAAPHRAIASWLAEQKDPEIKWEKDFVEKHEDFEDALEKHERFVVEQVRNIVFGPKLDAPATSVDAYMVYSPEMQAYTVMDRGDLRKSLETGVVGRYDVIRHLSMTDYAVLGEDFDG